MHLALWKSTLQMARSPHVEAEQGLTHSLFWQALSRGQSWSRMHSSRKEKIKIVETKLEGFRFF